MAHIGMVLIGDIRYDGRVRKEIGTLVAAGHQVDLVVSNFGKTCSADEDLGVRLHYIRMTLWSNPASNFLEQLSFNRKATLILREIALTHIHCHDLSSLLAGVWAKKKTRAKLVFDAHELMPESLGGIKQTIWGCIEKKCVRNCDHILMPEKNRIAYFKRKYPSIPEPQLLQNLPRKSEIPQGKWSLFREKYPIKADQRIVLYTGLIAHGRHIEDLVDAMSLCGEEFVLVIMGRAFKGYDVALAARIRKLGIEHRVFFHEPVPHTMILRYMASCDMGTAFYDRSNVNNYYCASNKLYEFIALSKAVVTNNYPGLLGVVENWRQGICLAEINARNLAEAFMRANDESMVTPGAKKFFWEDEQSILLRLYGNY